MITRAAAITPAIILIGVRGEGSVNDLLNLSQFVLAIQLPLAMFPLALVYQLASGHGHASQRLVSACDRLVFALFSSRLWTSTGCPDALHDAMAVFVHH